MITALHRTHTGQQLLLLVGPLLLLSGQQRLLLQLLRDPQQEVLS
jgi:hypothetical protein